jgi:hypothetical protein
VRAHLLGPPRTSCRARPARGPFAHAHVRTRWPPPHSPVHGAPVVLLRRERSFGVKMSRHRPSGRRIPPGAFSRDCVWAANCKVRRHRHVLATGTDSTKRRRVATSSARWHSHSCALHLRCPCTPLAPFARARASAFARRRRRALAVPAHLLPTPSTRAHDRSRHCALPARTPAAQPVRARARPLVSARARPCPRSCSSSAPRPSSR